MLCSGGGWVGVCVGGGGGDGCGCVCVLGGGGAAAPRSPPDARSPHPAAAAPRAPPCAGTAAIARSSAVSTICACLISVESLSMLEPRSEGGGGGGRQRDCACGLTHPRSSPPTHPHCPHPLPLTLPPQLVEDVGGGVAARRSQLGSSAQLFDSACQRGGWEVERGGTGADVLRTRERCAERGGCAGVCRCGGRCLGGRMRQQWSSRPVSRHCTCVRTCVGVRVGGWDVPSHTHASPPTHPRTHCHVVGQR